MKPQVTIVAALNHQYVIGVDNRLPWHIPEDLAYFKKITLGKPIIMGRKTFESIGRVLPGRKNIVISRNGFSHDGVTTYTSLEAAITDNSDVAELCIIGGAELFALSIDLADKMCLTWVDYPLKLQAKYFPLINFNRWRLVSEEDIISSQGIPCSFCEYQRFNK